MVSFTSLVFVASFVHFFVGAVPFNNLITRQSSNDTFALSNAQLAQQMNLAAITAQVGDSCPNDGVPSCIGTGVSQCLNNQLLAPQPCGQDTQCVTLPAVGEAGVVIACDTLSDAIMRITSTGATGGLTGVDITGTDNISAETSAVDKIPGAIPAVPKVI